MKKSYNKLLDIIFRDGGYYRKNGDNWDLIIFPRLDINLESITAINPEETTEKLLLQFDKDITDFIDMENIKIGGELLVDKVRFLGNGLYELDISGVTKTEDVDINLKKN